MEDIDILEEKVKFIDISLYPCGFHARARIPLDGKIPEPSLKQDYLDSLQLNRVTDSYVRFDPPISLDYSGVRLLLYWSDHRKEWISMYI